MKKQENEKAEKTSALMDDLHKCEQEILDAFAEICKENGLRYYIIAGTLLGAVRHKGPIPWDDDADVCMPRSDLEKFKKIMLSRPDGELYHIHCYENDPNYAVFTVKLKKRGTVYKSENLLDVGWDHLELWLDIFPLDEAPEKADIFYRIHGMRIALMKRLVSNKARNNSSGKSLKARILHFILKPFSFDFLHSHTEKLMKKYNNKARSCFVSWASHYHFLKQTMPKSWYEPATEVFYSGKYYSAPCDWDKVLTNLYGDYMKLPAEKDRETHDAFEIKT